VPETFTRLKAQEFARLVSSLLVKYIDADSWLLSDMERGALGR
jgi:hypothetical protein